MRSKSVFITAYRSDRCMADNRRLMKSLRNDLLTQNYKPRPCISRWYGVRRPIYMIYSYPWNVKFFLDLSKKYGQNTLIFWGDVYDVATGRVIGKVSENGLKNKTKPEHPRWVYLGSNTYILLDTSVPLDLLDTLTTWSSGSSDGGADLNHCLRA
jgi:hypothetical protein